MWLIYCNIDVCENVKNIKVRIKKHDDFVDVLSLVAIIVHEIFDVIKIVTSNFKNFVDFNFKNIIDLIVIVVYVIFDVIALKNITKNIIINFKIFVNVDFKNVIDVNENVLKNMFFFNFYSIQHSIKFIRDIVYWFWRCVVATSIFYILFLFLHRLI